MTKVAVFAVIATGAACTGGEPVTDLGQVFGDRPAVASVDPRGVDGGLSIDAGPTNAPRSRCAISEGAKTGLLAYFPFDNDLASHAGRAIATAQTQGRFAPGKIGRGLAGGEQAIVSMSLSLTLAHYTVCAWIAPGPGDDGSVQVLTPDDGLPFAVPVSPLRKNDFNFVCWQGDGANEQVVVDVDRAASSHSVSHTPTTSLRFGSPSANTIVDEVAIFGPVLGTADLQALRAGGRGCLLEGLQ